MTALDQSSPLLNDLSLDHPHLAKALDQLQEAIASPDTRQTALVIGPTGVGKTHLSKRITFQLNQRYLAEAKRDPQFLPVVQVTVPMVTDRGFSWRGYYDTCLHAVGCPFPAFKTVSEARDKLVATLKLRRVKVVFLDELQHLLHIGTTASLLRQSEKPSVFTSRILHLELLHSLDYWAPTEHSFEENSARLLLKSRSNPKRPKLPVSANMWIAPSPKLNEPSP